MESRSAFAFNPCGFGAPSGVRTSTFATVHRSDFQMKQTTEASEEEQEAGVAGGFGRFGAAFAEQLSKFTSDSATDSVSYTGKRRPGEVSPMRKVPDTIQKPDYADDGVPKETGPFWPWQIVKKSAEDIEGMRAAGRVAREVLDAAVRKVAVGVTTEEIDAVVHAECIKRGAYPSPLNYKGFPKSCCTSVNEVILHGIPDSNILEDGDIVNIDVTVYYGGYHGDCAEMALVGNVDEEGKKLVKVTYDAWQQAIAYCRPGKPYQVIGAIIEDYVQANGYQSTGAFCGHGIGKGFHENPQVLHVRNENPTVMEEGHIFTIEPMVCEGTASHILWKDKWTATTQDGLRAAQFEHTFLCTPYGLEVLTERLPTSAKYWWEKE